MSMPTPLVRILQLQENSLDALLVATAAALGKSARADVTRTPVVALTVMGAFARSFLSMVYSTNVDIARYMTQREVEETEAYLKKLNDAVRVSPIFADFVRKADKYVDTFPERIAERKLFGLSSVERIKSVHDGATQVVRAIVDTGVANGKSSMEIAKEIEQYIRPDDKDLKVSPYDYLRQKFPTMKASELAQIPQGSVSYNAFTIARTESNETYRNTVVDLQEGQPWHLGYKWNLSRSHPKPDICDIRAKADHGMGPGVYNKENLPREHPNGFCFITSVQMPITQMKRFLDTGKVPAKPKFKGTPMTEEEFRKSEAKK